MIIADANLIAGFCINSPLTETAQAVFAKDRSWSAPKLWQSEFVSTLLKYRRLQKMSANEVMRALYYAESMMGESDYDSDIHEVYRVVNATGCSAYDSCYIALAEEHRVKLVTTDGGILANAPHIALSPEQFLAA